VVDDRMGGDVKITVIATGFSSDAQRNPSLAEKYQATRPLELQDPLPERTRQPQLENPDQYEDVDIPAFLREPR
jgi:cell division protein FtsZ